MATIIVKYGNKYTCLFSKPETDWIIELAKTMGITKEAVVGAAMNKGLTYYVETFCREVEPPKKEIDDDACDDLC